MKTWMKVSAATVVITSGVVVYLFLQPRTVMNETSSSLRPSTRLVDETGGAQGLGAGERPWANQYDERGQLTYRFRAGQFNPIDSGTVAVSGPAFEFYLAGGRRVVLTGETGQVFLPRRGASGGAGGRGGGVTLGGAGGSGGSPAVPTRGTMRNVQIKLFESDDAQVALVADMDNVVFDNDTLRIWTDDAVIGGVRLAGNKIPVTVRGNDYDFDGEGLTIQLTNPGDRRIQRLEVARATRLVIKSTDIFRPREEGGGAIGLAAPTDLRLASTDPAALAVAAAQSPAAPAPAQAPQPNPADVVYRATIRNKLLIQQGESTSITGDVLQIDFSSLPKPKAQPLPSAVAPAPPTPAAPLAPAAPATPTAALATQSPPAMAVAAPTTVPTSDPIVVTWDGPLRVDADAGDAQTPPGEAVATILGSPDAPAVLKQGGSVATATAIGYETATRMATLQGSERLPVTLADDRGSVVTTHLVRYDLAGRIVRMAGATVVRSPVDPDDAGQPKILLASWSTDAEFRFTDPKAGVGGAVGNAAGGLAGLGGDASPQRGGGGGRIEFAKMTGSVRVDHPQLRMSSESLALTFAASGKRPGAARQPAAVGGADVRSIVAEGKVVAVLSDDKPNAPPLAQGIRGERLTLTTAHDPSGRLFVDRLESLGSVVASDRDQELSANALVITMAPDPAAKAGKGGLGSGKPQTMSASGDVVARANDGSVVRAGTLSVANLSGDRTVHIVGRTEAPADGPAESRWASVSGQGSTLSSARIVYSEADGKATIPGPGKLEGTQKAQKPGGKDTPFTVTWTDSALLDGPANQIDVKGGISFETVDADGGVAVATGKALRVILADSPENIPAAPAALNASERGQARLLGSKSMKGVELEGDVRIQSLLGDAQGKAVRQFNLFSDRVNYDQAGGLTVPGAGRLLLIDRRAEAAGAPTPAPKPGEALLPNGRGNTAMQWKDSLVYDLATRQIVFSGAVVFVHEPLAPGDTAPAAVGGGPDRFRLDADRVIAQLGGSAGPAAGPAPELGSEQIRSVSAIGDVTFAARGVTVRASELDLDPTAQLVVARGRDRIPVRVDDERGTGSGTFSLARINLKTGQVEDLQNPTGNLGVGGLGLPTAPPKK